MYLVPLCVAIFALALQFFYLCSYVTVAVTRRTKVRYSFKTTHGLIDVIHCNINPSVDLLQALRTFQLPCHAIAHRCVRTKLGIYPPDDWIQCTGLSTAWLDMKDDSPVITRYDHFSSATLNERVGAPVVKGLGEAR